MKAWFVKQFERLIGPPREVSDPLPSTFGVEADRARSDRNKTNELDIEVAKGMSRRIGF